MRTMLTQTNQPSSSSEPDNFSKGKEFSAVLVQSHTSRLQRVKQIGAIWSVVLALVLMMQDAKAQGVWHTNTVRNTLPAMDGGDSAINITRFIYREANGAAFSFIAPQGLVTGAAFLANVTVSQVSAGPGEPYPGTVSPDGTRLLVWGADFRDFDIFFANCGGDPGQGHRPSLSDLRLQPWGSYGIAVSTNSLGSPIFDMDSSDVVDLNFPGNLTVPVVAGTNFIEMTLVNNTFNALSRLMFSETQNTFFDDFKRDADGANYIPSPTLAVKADVIWFEASSVAPSLSIAAANGRLSFSWSDASFHLEQSAELQASSWSRVAGTSPVLVDMTNAAGFFRLAK